MWPEGQWEASKKNAPDGADTQTNRLYDQLGPVGPSWWKWGKVNWVLSSWPHCVILFETWIAKTVNRRYNIQRVLWTKCIMASYSASTHINCSYLFNPQACCQNFMFMTYIVLFRHLLDEIMFVPCDWSQTPLRPRQLEGFLDKLQGVLCGWGVGAEFLNFDFLTVSGFKVYKLCARTWNKKRAHKIGRNMQKILGNSKNH